MVELSRLHIDHHHLLVALLQGFLNGLLQTVLLVFAYLHAVDHKLDVVVAVAVGLHPERQLLEFSIHPDIEVPLLPKVFEKFLIMSLTVPYQRSEYIYLAVGKCLADHFHYLLLGVFHHRLAADVASRLAEACEKQTEEVVDLRRCSYGGAWIVVGCLLLYADHGVETCDLIYIGTLHTAEEVAGIGGKSLYVATLALGEDGIEGQR